VFGSTALELNERLQLRAKADEKLSKEVVSKSLSGIPRVLGIFTGQGAQWPRMGAELLGNTHVATAILEHLDDCLAELPDGPSWSIKGEILAEGRSSRINKAEISQPVCTAVQILLVDVLVSAGIKFEAVVGHSSGEIGAAYAAGYLSAKDAIRIAYYRGMHLNQAGGPNGEKGAMMAVGTSFQDAQELCEMPELKGRINIAASNSFSSVTISGDADAVHEAQGVLEDERKFARLLKTDKAYHSHHMLPCSQAYMKSLVDCKVKVLRPRSGITWISSVYNENAANCRDILKDEYWVSNMVRPVMFSQAIETSIAESGPFDIGIECGPHPALKGPVLQVIQEVLGEPLPYTGLLSRGRNDNQALAEGLGYLWQALGDRAVDYGAVDKFLAGPDAAAPKMLVNLPSYAWDHDRVYTHECRQYGAYRTRPDASHELLGVRVLDGTKEQLRWRNMVRPREVPWISGHQIQGQMVFPAAGHLCSALSALQFAADGLEMKLVEIEDFEIGQAMVFNDDNSSVETQ
jgi:hybrid polyketide synthase/nonribosomal peptide synthetase ACE1